MDFHLRVRTSIVDQVSDVIPCLAIHRMRMFLYYSKL